jgi:hypothetical protein
LLEIPTQLEVVVDLAVEHDRQATILGHHWLMPEWRDVDHGEATMSEQDTGGSIRPHTGVVRATVGETRQHAIESFLSEVQPRRLGEPNTRNATHDVIGNVVSLTNEARPLHRAGQLGARANQAWARSVWSAALPSRVHLS